MVVDFQSTNFKADIKLLNFIEQKLTKLQKLNQQVLNARVYLKVDKSKEGLNKFVEIKINLPENQLFAQENNKSFEVAAESVIEALKHQLSKIKTKNLTATG